MPKSGAPVLGADLTERISRQLPDRAQRIAAELATAARTVLSGRRSGRGGASLPGEPPAEQSGKLLNSWRPMSSVTSTANGATFAASIRSEGAPYVALFDPELQGYQPRSGKPLAPRPFVDRILEQAQPRIQAVLAEPWLR